MTIKKLFIVSFIIFSAACFGQVKAEKDSAQINTAAADTLSADTTASADSVSLSQIVASQIAAARQKQISDSLEAAKAPAVKTEAPPAQNIGIAGELLERARSIYYENTDIVLKTAFLLAVSIVAFIIILLRRRKSRPKELQETSLKKNVRMLREEKMEFNINPELKMMRKRLLHDPSINFTSRDSISRTARELNISKGELMLAASIKSHEMAKSCLNK